MAKDPQDMFFAIQRMYERHKDQEGDEIKDLAQAVLHLYGKVYDLGDDSESLDNRMNDLEAR
jgi:hypothetical protein